MPKFAANLTTMFTELPFAQRFAAAREAGFMALECQYPYGHDISEVKRWLDESDLQMILINTPSGDSGVNESGLAALPGRESDFRQSFEQSLAYATGLGAGMIHVLAGVVPNESERLPCEQAFITNVRWAAELARAHQVNLLLEPLNQRDVPGYLHSTTAQTRRLIDMIDRENVRLQFDFYHLQIMEGDLTNALSSQFDVLGHVQFSSLPGRYEPQYGELNMFYFFDLLDEIGYSGWVGCEYGAKTTTAHGLTWAAPFGLGISSS